MKTVYRLVCVLPALLSVVMPVSSWSQGENIQLPKPVYTGKTAVETAIARKKSVRNFTGKPVSLAEVSQLLWAANGAVPADAVSGATSRVVPSAGGLYPLEVFLVAGANTVKDLPAGVYQYLPAANALVRITEGDNRMLLASACLSQTWMAKAPVMVIIGGLFLRTTAKYGNRGSQYVLMEAGNSNQNLCLQAESLGLGVGTVGAFQDHQVVAAARLPAGITPLLVMAVGK